jgi:protein O-mannosyl-transferase
MQKLLSDVMSPQKNIKRFAIFLIAIVGVLAYVNSFNNSFQFDDGFHIVEGTKIKDISNVLTLNHWKAIGNRPLSFFTLAVDYKLATKNANGVPSVVPFHITNLLFHILSAFMAFLLSLEILSLAVFKKNKVIEDNKVLIALFTALIFVTHPIQTQAVTYIIQRMAVLAGFFYMWAVLLYIRGRKIHLKREAQIDWKSLHWYDLVIPNFLKSLNWYDFDKPYLNYRKIIGWKPYIFYAAAFFAGFLGFLSKQNAVTFPVAFILVEILFIRNEKQKVDWKFVSITSAAVGIVIMAVLITNSLPREFEKISRLNYLYTQFRVLVKYWQLLLLPVNQHLDYFFTVSTTLWGEKELASLAVILLSIGLGVWLFMKKWFVASFAIFWFYLTLSLESSIIPIRDVIFEHRLYLAVFGFGFAISYLAFYFLNPKNAKYPIIALSVLTSVYVGASINRNMVWKNPYTLWSDSVKKSPERERAWYWLATYYSEVKDRENALKCYDTSIKCNPGFPLAYNGRANLNKESGNLENALKDYDMAIKLDPKYLTAFYNRGITYAALNKLDLAIADYDHSIQLGNNTSAIYYNRGNAKRRSKQYDSAIEDYNVAIKKDPKNPLCFFNRGLTKAQLEKHSDAIQDMDLAIRIDPKNHLFYNGKGVSLIALKKYQEAISNFDLCVKINPDFGQAYYNRGYVKQTAFNDKDGACKDWEMASAKGYKAAEMQLNQFCRQPKTR